MATDVVSATVDGMHEVWTTAELSAAGMSRRELGRALESGRLLRVRKGHYVRGDAPEALVRAATIGGRIGCVSLLALHGVFVFDAEPLHVHMEPGDSRMRTPFGGSSLAARGARQGVVLHWQRLREPPASGSVDIVDAVIHSVRCQPPRHAIATLDSVLNRGLMTPDELTDALGALPARYRVLRGLVDGRAQAGTESLVRLMLRASGYRVDVQVHLAGAGRLDLLVDGWLVVECDSRQFHSSWEQRRIDYRRDLAAARRGWCVLRLLAEDILHHPDQVLAALRGLLDARRVHG